jgi:hypothetical protein
MDVGVGSVGDEAARKFSRGGGGQNKVVLAVMVGCFVVCEEVWENRRSSRKSEVKFRRFPGRGC